MHRIGDQLSKADLNKSNPISSEDSNLEECMYNIQSNLKMMYAEDEDLHIGSYNVNAISGFHSQYLSNNKLIEEQYDSNRDRVHFTSQQSNDYLLEDKNKQIRQLNQELAELRSQQQLTQFEQFESYQKIIDSLKKEISQLQSKRMSNEAYSQINSARVQEQSDQLKEYQQTTEQQCEQINDLQSQLKDSQEQFRMISNKNNIMKQDISVKAKQINQLTRDYEDIQAQLIRQQKENEGMRRLIEEMQSDIDQKSDKQDFMSVIELLETVLTTIHEFVLDYDKEMNKFQISVKYSTDLKRLLIEYQKEDKISIWQGVERLSGLLVSVFEQLAYDIKQIDADQKKIQHMSQQIESLEQMTICLENSLGQYEAVNREQQGFIRLVGDKTKQEREELVNALMNKTSNDQQFTSLEKVIDNLEQVTEAQTIEIKSLKDKLATQTEQTQIIRKTYQEENIQLKVYENKLKKQHQDGLFMKELLQKLSAIIGNENTSRVVEQILELQQKITLQSQDEIEIRSKLEVKELDLKQQINDSRLSMNDMIERRRDVEGMRGIVRNCQRQIEMNREKIEMLIRELDTNVMNEKCQQFKVTYLPRDFHKRNTSQIENISDCNKSDIQSKSLLAEKLQKTMRI